MATLTLKTSSQRSRGIFLLVLGMFLFSIQDAIVRLVSGDYPVHQVVGVRSVFGTILLLGFMGVKGEFGKLRTNRPIFQFTRGFCMFLAYTTYYMAFVAMPMAEAVSIYFINPLIVTFLSVIFLREKLKPIYLWAVIVGFAGVLLMVRPGAGLFEPVVILPVLAAFFYGITVIMARKMSATENGLSLAFYPTLLYLILPLLLFILFPKGFPINSTHPSLQFLSRGWVIPTWTDFWLMAIIGVISAVGFFCLSEAYRLTEASGIVAFEYIMLPLVAVWGFLLWGEIPSIFTLVGGTLVVVSGLMTAGAKVKSASVGRAMLVVVFLIWFLFTIKSMY